MSIAPQNYTIQYQDPVQGVMDGYKNALLMQQAQAQADMQQAKAAQQQQYQSDVSKLLGNPDSTGHDYANVMMRNPDFADHVKKSWDVLSADQQKQNLSTATKIYSALDNGQPDLAKQIADNEAMTYRQSGRQQDAQNAEQLSKIIDQNPKVALGLTKASIALSPGSKDVVGALSGFGQEERATQLAPAELRLKGAEATTKETEAALAPQKAQAEVQNLQSQITERANRMGLDKDKLMTDTQLKMQELQNKGVQVPTDVRELINKRVEAATTADQSAAKMYNLADKFDGLGNVWSGQFGNMAEATKAYWGSEDALTQLRKEYDAIKVSNVSKNLPPGAASDKDVKLAMGPMLPATANPPQVASFLRGLGKLQSYDAAYNNAASEWANANNGILGAARSNLEVDGIKVPKGQTFVAFSRAYMQEKAKEQEAKYQQDIVKNRYGVQ